MSQSNPESRQGGNGWWIVLLLAVVVVVVLAYQAAERMGTMTLAIVVGVVAGLLPSIFLAAIAYGAGKRTGRREALYRYGGERALPGPVQAPINQFVLPSDFLQSQMARETWERPLGRPEPPAAAPEPLPRTWKDV